MNRVNGMFYLNNTIIPQSKPIESNDDQLREGRRNQSFDPTLIRTTFYHQILPNNNNINNLSIFPQQTMTGTTLRKRPLEINNENVPIDEGSREKRDRQDINFQKPTDLNSSVVINVEGGVGEGSNDVQRFKKLPRRMPRFIWNDQSTMDLLNLVYRIKFDHHLKSQSMKINISWNKFFREQSHRKSNYNSISTAGFETLERRLNFISRTYWKIRNLCIGKNENELMNQLRTHHLSKNMYEKLKEFFGHDYNFIRRRVNDFDEDLDRTQSRSITREDLDRTSFINQERIESIEQRPKESLLKILDDPEKDKKLKEYIDYRLRSYREK